VDFLSTISKIFSNKWFRIGLSLGISGLALYLALRDVDIQQVWQTLISARLSFILLALSSVAVNTAAKSFRWKVLVGPPGEKISFWQYLIILLVGQMLNTLFPARMGDLSRAYVLGGKGPGRTYVFGTVMLEKVLDSISYALLFFVLLVFIPLPAWIGGSIFMFVGVTLVISAGIALLIFRRGWFIRFCDLLLGKLPQKMRMWLEPRIQSGLASLDVIKRGDDALKLIAWTIVIWLTAILTNQITLLALGIRLPLTASLLILIGLQAGISLPSVPGRIGIFEYICVLALSLFLIDQTIALGFGFLLHGIVLVPSTLIGLISFWYLGLAKERPKFDRGVV
jgi:uncharacterized protein (TIRG00374 family)